MKKLLIASDCFLPRWDGIARFLAEIIPKIKDEFEITVIAPEFPGKRIAIKDVKIERIPVKKYSVGDFQPAKIMPLKIRKLVKEAHDNLTRGMPIATSCEVLHTRMTI